MLLFRWAGLENLVLPQVLNHRDDIKQEARRKQWNAKYKKSRHTDWRRIQEARNRREQAQPVKHERNLNSFRH
jgi:hypothetical protein